MNLNKLFDKIPYGTFANFTPAHFWGMGAALVVAIVAASYFLLLNPNIDEMAQLDNKIEEASKKLDLYLTEGAKKEAITKEVAALSGTLVEKKRQLPLASEVPQLIHKIADIGEFLGLDIVAFKLEPAKDNDFYKTIPLSVTVAGNYYQTAGFFDALQNLLRVVNIEKFTMGLKPGFKIVTNEEGEPEQEQIKILQTEISASTFAYIEGSELTDKK
ncbi:MAG: type 4a pilus biogenesis protein PilO [Nitrospinae bacterium]|nr:type 4a pilus biogenesis protein PilO [Nitrospinota bacterium]